MVKQRWVEYVRANKGKYPLESLKTALMKAGASFDEAEEAAALALEPPPGAASTLPPPPVSPREHAEAAAAAVAGAASSLRAEFDPRAIAATAKRVLLTPEEFFRNLSPGGGIREPFVFFCAMTAVAVALKMFLSVVFYLTGKAGYASAASAAAVIGGTLGAGVALMILIPLFGFCGAGLLYGVWLLLGSRQELKTAYRCMAYASALMPVSLGGESIPWLGLPISLAATAYGFYLYVLASVEVHKIPRKKALIAFGILAGIMLLSQISTRLALWRAERAAQQLGLLG